MKIKTAIYIIITLFLASCKKEEPLQVQSTSPDLKRIEIRASENRVLVDGNVVFTPALFYWEVGEIHKVEAFSSWGGSFASVSLEIYKDLQLDKEARGMFSVTINYEVQP